MSEGQSEKRNVKPMENIFFFIKQSMEKCPVKGCAVFAAMLYMCYKRLMIKITKYQILIEIIKQKVIL